MIGMVFSIIALLVLSIGVIPLGFGVGTIIVDHFEDSENADFAMFIGSTLWIAFSFVSILCKVKWCGFWYSVLYGVLAVLAASLIWYIGMSVSVTRYKKQKEKQEREREERRKEEEREREERRRQEELRQQRERERRDAEERQRRQREADQKNASGKLSDMAKDI